MTSLPDDASINYVAGEPAGVWTTAVHQLYQFVAESIGSATATALVIAGGAITPAQGAHTVDTEGSAATDDLTTLNTDNLPDGRWVILRPATTARVVTVKHLAGGAGQITLLDATDYPLASAADFIVLERNGTDWREVFRRYVKPAPPPAADTSTQGLIEIATATEADAGTDTVRAMTPALVKRRVDAIPSQVPAGSVFRFAGASAPTGFLLCDGSPVSRVTYAGLFSAIGTTYGVGDGTTTFNVPDLRGRVTIGAGQGAGLTNRALGASGGEETHQITAAEMPVHGHPFRATYQTANSAGAQTTGGFLTNNQTGVTSQPAYTGAVSNNQGQQIGGSGGDQAHNNMQPFLVMNAIIKT